MLSHSVGSWVFSTMVFSCGQLPFVRASAHAIGELQLQTMSAASHVRGLELKSLCSTHLCQHPAFESLEHKTQAWRSRPLAKDLEQYKDVCSGLS